MLINIVFFSENVMSLTGVLLGLYTLNLEICLNKEQNLLLKMIIGIIGLQCKGS